MTNMNHIMLTQTLSREIMQKHENMKIIMQKFENRYFIIYLIHHVFSSYHRIICSGNWSNILHPFKPEYGDKASHVVNIVKVSILT